MFRVKRTMASSFSGDQAIMHPSLESSRAQVAPLPQNFRSVQPGGGRILRIELAWGALRRAWLKRFRPGYVRRMAALRSGSSEGAPHEVLDPRDLKFCRNQCACDWEPGDDPFRWRDRIPFARWGLAELFLIGGALVALTAGLLVWLPWAAIAPAIPAALVIWFFRSPRRSIPDVPDTLVSPADGKVVEISRLEHDAFIGGPAVRIGVFLSIFNVHVNRAPCRARVVKLDYAPGEFLNAMKPESSTRNESVCVWFEEESPPHRRFLLRQISGAIASRIVNGLRPGEVVERGAVFGMIKFGSRTELILPARRVALRCRLGDRLRAGVSIVAQFGDEG
jgi:phosphatidylserine decarboxylase